MRKEKRIEKWCTRRSWPSACWRKIEQNDSARPPGGGKTVKLRCKHSEKGGSRASRVRYTSNKIWVLPRKVKIALKSIGGEIKHPAFLAKLVNAINYQASLHWDSQHAIYCLRTKLVIILCRTNMWNKKKNFFLKYRPAIHHEPHAFETAVTRVNALEKK